MSKSYKQKEKDIEELEKLIYICLNCFDFEYLFSQNCNEEYKLAVKLYDNGYRYLSKADKHTIKRP